MKNSLKFGLAAVCALAASSFAQTQDFCSTATHSGTAKETSTNVVGTFPNGIGYELWNEGGHG